MLRRPSDAVLPWRGARTGAPVLLLVGADAGFAASVREEAEALGGWRVLAVAEPREALALLLGDTWFSHLIVPAATPQEILRALLGLTAGEPDSGTMAVLIGEGAEKGRDLPGWGRAVVVPQPRAGWLRPLLAPSWADAAPGENALAPAEALASLDAGRLYTRYQPLVDIASGRLMAFETLARLDHPRLGPLSPDRFVPPLEKAGQALKLAALVAERAFSDLRAHRLDLCGAALGLNLPLGVVQLACLAERLGTWRRGTDLAAERIAIELTESVPVAEPERLRPILQRLRAAGYRLSLDDVGPDTPNYEELLALPFLSVKLDKDLVHASAGSAAALEHTRRIVASAHRHHCRTIAEGVETVADWERMAAIGVDWAQGFLIARPLAAEATALWWQEWQRRNAARRRYLVP